MSRALGAAFLGHQVAKLESRINQDAAPSFSPSSSPRGGRGRGGRGGRVWNPDRGAPRVRKRSFSLHPVAVEPGSEQQQPLPPVLSPSPVIIIPKEKPAMANVIVLDASVLVYALGQVKRWCKDERKEVLIVPLEGKLYSPDHRAYTAHLQCRTIRSACCLVVATLHHPCMNPTVLNTLDLLKKGTSPLAIHARAASRFLEAQVGANPRIHVQRDDDFCPWDDIYSNAVTAATSTLAEPSDESPLPSEDRAPEWMRQIVCCTVWEMRQPAQRQATQPGSDKNRSQPPKVALAVVKPVPNSFLDTNPPSTTDAGSIPNPSANDSFAQTAFARHAIRATGDLVRIWAPLLGVKVLNIEQGASESNHSGPSQFRSPSANDFSKSPPVVPGSRRGTSSGGHRKNRSSDDPPFPVIGRGTLVEKVKSGVDSKSIVVAPGASSAILGTPPGVNKIRLLTRGEKLEP